MVTWRIVYTKQAQKDAKKIAAAGVNTMYLSFDGTTPQTNPKNHYEVPRTLEACRKAGIGVSSDSTARWSDSASGSMYAGWERICWA